MQGAFGTVIWIVCLGGIVVAVVALLSGSRTWDEFGKAGMTMERDQPRKGAPAATERDEEIRQLLQARNAMRQRRGEAPVDVEAELGRLNAVHIDPELRAEIRQLVVARNKRRARAGKPELDVEREVEREIRDLHGL